MYLHSATYYLIVNIFIILNYLKTFRNLTCQKLYIVGRSVTLVRSVNSGTMIRRHKYLLLPIRIFINIRANLHQHLSIQMEHSLLTNRAVLIESSNHCFVCNAHLWIEHVTKSHKNYESLTKKMCVEHYHLSLASLIQTQMRCITLLRMSVVCEGIHCEVCSNNL